MSTSRFGGVIFDLDGTLLDTLEDIGNAANAVLAHHGFPPHPIPAYRQFVGEGVQLLMKRSLPPAHRDEATLQACLETMKTEYVRNLNKTAKPYPGIAEVLRKLTAASLKLAVLSNKPDEFTSRCVTDFFGHDIFQVCFGLRPGVPRKPDPAGALEIARSWAAAPGDILYVGDSGTDMQTATAAGMFPLGVLWGYRSRDELLAHGAKAVIEKPDELLSFLGLRDLS